MLLPQKKGVQIGRKAALDKTSIDTIKDLWRSGKNKLEIAQEMGVSRVIFYVFLKKHKAVLEKQNVA